MAADGAWQVLGDPGRRAAYDRSANPGRRPSRVRVTVRRPPAAPGPAASATSPGRPVAAPGPPLAAGPVRVEGGQALASRVGAWDGEDARLALLAELWLRCRGPIRPW